MIMEPGISGIIYYYDKRESGHGNDPPKASSPADKSQVKTVVRNERDAAYRISSSPLGGERTACH